MPTSWSFGNLLETPGVIFGVLTPKGVSINSTSDVCNIFFFHIIFYVYFPAGEMNLFFPYHPWDNCIFYLHEKPIFYRSKTTIHVAKYTSQVPWMVRDLTNFAKEMMDWNSCLTIGLGEGVGVALRRSGVLEGPGSGGRLSACLGALECLIPR